MSMLRTSLDVLSLNVSGVTSAHRLKADVKILDVSVMCCDVNSCTTRHVMGRLAAERACPDSAEEVDEPSL